MTNSSNNIRIITSLLLNNNRLVKGKIFSNYVDAGDPIKTCVAHDSQLCDEITIIDLNAYKNNSFPDCHILEKISSEVTTPILYGGNITDIKTVEVLIRNGADKVLINSNIFKKNLTKDIINFFGKQSLVGGIDIISIEGKYKIYQRGEIIDTNYIDYIKKVFDQNVGEIKVTFVNLEGTRKGLDIETAKKIIDISPVPVIIEGGTKNLKDIEIALKNGINAIALGSMLVFSDNHIFKIKQYLENSGINVRLRY
jgi:imidazole glycerol-phosphate synthase subunit HisF